MYKTMLPWWITAVYVLALLDLWAALRQVKFTYAEDEEKGDA